MNEREALHTSDGMNLSSQTGRYITPTHCDTAIHQPTCNRSSLSLAATLSALTTQTAMRAALLALLAGLCAVSAAPAPAIDERAAPPAIYNKQGSLAVLGVGSTNSDYNETVDFNGQGTLALESSSGPFTLVSSEWQAGRQ